MLTPRDYGRPSARQSAASRRRLARERRDLARKSEVAQQIAAVGRDLDIENRVRGKERTDRRADFRLRRKDQKPLAVGGEMQLARAAKHSLRFDAAQLADFDLEVVRQGRAGQRDRHLVADLVVFGAANDLAVMVRAVIDIANAEAIGVRMLRRGVDLSPRPHWRCRCRGARCLRSRRRQRSAAPPVHRRWSATPPVRAAS